jgi:uncharacterized cupredoxin-like copper-binding protein
LRRSSLVLAAATTLLLLAGAAVADEHPIVPSRTVPPPSGQAYVFTVQMGEYRYDPARIELHVGQPYVMHLTNAGHKEHDLNAPGFFASVTLAPASAALIRHGGVELDKGESADIAFTPTHPGVYEMRCTEPFHDFLGMRGLIVVK